MSPILIVVIVIALILIVECVFFFPDKMPWNKKRYEKKIERWWESDKHNGTN